MQRGPIGPLCMSAITPNWPGFAPPRWPAKSAPLTHREALGYVDGALRVGRRSHVARQDDRVVHGAGDDLGSWNRGFQHRPQFADVATDAEFVFRELPPLRVDREHRRLALGGAHQIDFSRRPHDRVGDGGIAHDDLRRVARQVEHDGFSDAHLNAARGPRKLGRPAVIALLRARRGEQQRRAHRRGESGADPFVRQAAHAQLSVAVAGKNLRSHHEFHALADVIWPAGLSSRRSARWSGSRRQTIR